ncbi:MAG: HAD family hydrolase [Bacteroidetes bacterium]|nr:HAD family hydrolase [Bacteroidota bacterium]
MCLQSNGKSFKLQKDLERLSLERVLEKYRVDLDPNEISQCLFDYWMNPQIFPETRDVISRINIPICLVSNIDNTELMSALDHTNMHFDHIVTSEDCQSYKPRSEMFEAALVELGFDREDVLHVGDSFSSDIVGAKKNGIKVMWINRKKRTIDDSVKPEYVSNDLGGILNILV